MPVTLRDIARKLELSPSLISAVLNDRPGIWAAVETRKRIHDAASDMGYRPNSAARSLRTGKTNTVAFVYQNTPEQQLGAVYSTAMETLAEPLGAMGYHLLVSAHNSYKGVKDTLFELASTRGCDMVVLWGQEGPVAEQAELLEQHNMPFAIKGIHEENHPDWPQIDFHHHQMMTDVVEYMHRIGHRNIAYLGFALDDLFCQRLLKGYKDSILRISGQTPPSEWMQFVSGRDMTRCESIIGEWLDMPKDIRPTAVAMGAGAHYNWHGIEMELAKRGIRLGNGSQDFAACGQCTQETQLIFGQASGFRQSEISDLAERMMDELVKPILEGREPASRVVKVVPVLHPIESLKLPLDGIRNSRISV